MIQILRKIRRQLLLGDHGVTYIKYALGEIFLVVIGILIALQVNNWNETRNEEKRIRAYAKSLIRDLQNDIKALNVSRSQADYSFQRIDSLKRYVNRYDIEDYSNTDLWVLAHDLLYRPHKWNRSTLDELKSSGSLRYITNDSLKKKLVEYETFSHHLDEDYSYDKGNTEKANELMARILNLNSPYFRKMMQLESEVVSNDSLLYLFSTPEYQNSKSTDLKLISYDPGLMSNYINTLVLIQDNYAIRAYMELPEIIVAAKEIIESLQAEYQI